jgi:hypothetical protein
MRETKSCLFTVSKARQLTEIIVKSARIVAFHSLKVAEYYKVLQTGNGDFRSRQRFYPWAGLARLDKACATIIQMPITRKSPNKAIRITSKPA